MSIYSKTLEKSKTIHSDQNFIFITYESITVAFVEEEK